MSNEHWGTLALEISWDPQELRRKARNGPVPALGLEQPLRILDTYLRVFFGREGIAALAGMVDYDGELLPTGTIFRCRVSHEISADHLRDLQEYAQNLAFKVIRWEQTPLGTG